MEKLYAGPAPARPPGTRPRMTLEIHGTVADGCEPVREEFAAFVAAQRPDHEGQLRAYVHGRRVLDPRRPHRRWGRAGAESANARRREAQSAIGPSTPAGSARRRPSRRLSPASP